MYNAMQLYNEIDNVGGAMASISCVLGQDTSLFPPSFSTHQGVKLGIWGGGG